MRGCHGSLVISKREFRSLKSLAFLWEELLPGRMPSFSHRDARDEVVGPPLSLRRKDPSRQTSSELFVLTGFTSGRLPCQLNRTADPLTRERLRVWSKRASIEAGEWGPLHPFRPTKPRRRRWQMSD